MRLYKLTTWVEVADDVDSAALWDALLATNKDWDGTLHFGVPWDTERHDIIEPYLPSLEIVAEVGK